MSRGRGRTGFVSVFLLVVGCQACPGSAPTPDPLRVMTGPVTIRPKMGPRVTLGVDDSAAATDFERRVAAAFNRGRTGAGLLVAEYDPVLGDVARAHARIYAEHGSDAAGTSTEAVLAWAGAVDPHPQYFVLDATYADEDDLLRHAEKLGGDPMAGEIGWVTLGVGRYAQGARSVLVAVVSDRVLRLEGVPRRHPPGSRVRLAGRLSEGARKPSILWLGEDGAVVEGDAPVVGPGGAFEAFVEVGRRRGPLLVEVLVEGPRGATVAALFPLSVGESPPREFTLQPPMDESGVRRPKEAASMILDSIQRERARRGLSPLVPHERTRGAAIAHAEAAARTGVLSHVDDRGHSPADRLAAAGVPAARVTENLARNRSLTDAHADLMRSLGHRQNIIDPEVTHVGIGVAIVPQPSGRRDFVIVCNFVRLVPRIDPRAEAAALLAVLNDRRREAGVHPLRRDGVLDGLSAALATQVLASGSVDGGPLAPDVEATLSSRRWARWSLQAYLVAIPREDATDGQAVLDPRATHLGVGVVQGDLDAGDVRTAVVLLSAGSR